MVVRIISAKVWVALHQVMLVMPKHLGLGQPQCPGSLHSSSKAFFHRFAKHETFGVYTCSAYAAYACIRMYSHVFAFGFPWEYMYTPPFSSGIQGVYAVYACIRVYSLLGFPSECWLAMPRVPVACEFELGSSMAWVGSRALRKLCMPLVLLTWQPEFCGRCLLTGLQFTGLSHIPNHGCTCVWLGMWMAADSKNRTKISRVPSCMDFQYH